MLLSHITQPVSFILCNFLSNSKQSLFKKVITKSQFYLKKEKFRHQPMAVRLSSLSDTCLIILWLNTKDFHLLYSNALFSDENDSTFSKKLEKIVIIYSSSDQMLMARVNMSFVAEQQVFGQITDTGNFDKDFYNAFLQAQVLWETFCVTLVLSNGSIKTLQFVATTFSDADLILMSSFYKQFELF